MSEKCPRFFTGPVEPCGKCKDHKGPCIRESEIPKPKEYDHARLR